MHLEDKTKKPRGFWGISFIVSAKSCIFIVCYIFLHRYKSRLYEAQLYGVRKSVYNGIAMGFMWLIVYSVYGLAFWYGIKLTIDEPENYTAGRTMIVSKHYVTSPHCMSVTSVDHVTGVLLCRHRSVLLGKRWAESAEDIDSTRSCTLHLSSHRQGDSIKPHIYWIVLSCKDRVNCRNLQSIRRLLLAKRRSQSEEQSRSSTSTLRTQLDRKFKYGS